MSPGHYKQGQLLVLKELFHVSMCVIEIPVYFGTVIHLGVNSCSVFFSKAM